MIFLIGSGRAFECDLFHASGTFVHENIDERRSFDEGWGPSTMSFLLSQARRRSRSERCQVREKVRWNYNVLRVRRQSGFVNERWRYRVPFNRTKKLSQLHLGEKLTCERETNAILSRVSSVKLKKLANSSSWRNWDTHFVRLVSSIIWKMFCKIRTFGRFFQPLAKW